jgi:hypothetical protein
MGRFFTRLRRPRTDTGFVAPPAGFTGRQMTAIVIAMMMMVVLWPVAASAAGSLVTIVDGSTNAKAKVDSTGALKVGGTVAVGGVTREAATTQYRHFYNLTSSTTCNTLSPAPPSGQGYLLRSLNVDVYGGAPGNGGKYISIYRDNHCVDIVATVTPGSLGVSNVDLGPGLTSKTTFSIRSSDATLSATVYGFGYLIPASGVVADAAPAGASPHQR